MESIKRKARVIPFGYKLAEDTNYIEPVQKVLDALEEAKEYLKKHEIKVKTKLFKDCEHRIPIEGTSLGLNFLKKNLL